MKLMVTWNEISAFVDSFFKLIGLWLIGVAFLLVIFFLNQLVSAPTLEPTETVCELQVMDKPLLTPEQRESVLKTDSVAFKRGNEWVTINYGAREALKGYY